VVIHEKDGGGGCRNEWLVEVWILDRRGSLSMGLFSDSLIS
jgi:hypothetical protein